MMLLLLLLLCVNGAQLSRAWPIDLLSLLSSQLLRWLNWPSPLVPKWWCNKTVVVVVGKWVRQRQRDGRQSVAAASASDVASLLSLSMRHAQRRLRLAAAAAAGFEVEHTADWLAGAICWTPSEESTHSHTPWWPSFKHRSLSPDSARSLVSLLDLGDHLDGPSVFSKSH